jgi:hypothetical protein
MLERCLEQVVPVALACILSAKKQLAAKPPHRGRSRVCVVRPSADLPVWDTRRQPRLFGAARNRLSPSRPLSFPEVTYEACCK